MPDLDNSTILKKAAYLKIMAAGLADSMKGGNFKSLYKGHGIEFSGVRDYIRGDDIRTIDWNVTARMGRPFVKVFEEEKEVQIFIVLDTSLSMKLKIPGQRTKFEAATEAAAILTMAADLNGFPIGAVFFDGQIYFSTKPTLSKEQTMMILTNLEKGDKKSEKGSALGAALTGAGKFLKNRSLVFVLSDFRSADWEKPLISLAQKNDVIALRLTDNFDNQLPTLGTVLFEDVESGQKKEFPSSSPAFQKEWHNYNKSRTSKWNDFCLKHGVFPTIFDTQDEPLNVLNSVFAIKRSL